MPFRAAITDLLWVRAHTGCTLSTEHVLSRDALGRKVKMRPERRPKRVYMRVSRGHARAAPPISTGRGFPIPLGHTSCGARAMTHRTCVSIGKKGSCLLPTCAPPPGPHPDAHLHLKNQRNHLTTWHCYPMALSSHCTSMISPPQLTAPHGTDASPPIPPPPRLCKPAPAARAPQFRTAPP